MKAFSLARTACYWTGEPSMSTELITNYDPVAMYIEDTIVAPATPVGTGAVAIIRLSGPKAVPILKTMWKPLNKGSLELRRLYLGDVVDPETHAHIDQAMAV